ncbi:glutamine--tRNA ligase/YqeY domain fusion protein [Rubinisphaera sp.]|uniref:glutamine--tRNA ligase/YqeY domain fusion protein n=1 Tax=Rubinisphaera sp. TaxID=2024857 RepID=UPI000C0D1230|nr:glutamine--tRNA ligase/YqeY domain fusion protein [Rubinisphaera sp.]MBV08583.1 glutamine--tRNA ligase [Rubinisphaera sp.]HCS53029.1 glutamine--tRNA ligase [Planctomycetaceae bacterium]|tara:strand:- start:879 stop:2573 length:1695 start_codon:yes stop_codon:yes gene_type:complete
MSAEKNTDDASAKPLDFIREIVAQDLKSGKHDGRVQTRFPPEPNGYLHIGHAKSICLNFGIAKEFGGRCNLRFDDTNPTKEETEYVDSIKEDVRWLGFEWDEEHYASDYFEQLYEWAEALIQKGLAYVDSGSLDEIRAQRGTVNEPGTPSPYRERSVEENLDLFRRMRAGEFPNGAHVLRAKIDMAAGNMNLRDPIMYRILHTPHHRTADKWCIYPIYDWAHGQSDSIEKITHSICTLEFEIHRPLYEWYIEHLDIFPSKQYEFARLNLTYMVMSKRKLLELVQAKLVEGWDDPRMPTIAGIRRRGYTPESLRKFCHTIGVTKYPGTTDISVLENSLRDDLNRRAERRMAVLDPVKVVITNYPEGASEELEAVNHPQDESFGTRTIPFGREIYIEREDFMEDPPKKFFRLSPGKEVRMRYAYFIKCEDVIKNEQGEVTEIHCTYDPETKGGNAPDGRKVKATLHWVPVAEAVDAEVRLYDHLFEVENPNDVPEGGDFKDHLNPNSLQVIKHAKLEPLLSSAQEGDRFQFERMGYFCCDRTSTAERPVFNRAVTLRDTWAKAKKQ